MKRLFPVITNIVFAIQVLLIFLLLFEQKVSLPIWLAPVGRMHPLILHFPIALLAFVGLLQFFRKEFNDQAFDKIQSLLLYITALSASLAALMGFFLAQEDGYSGDILNWHKWTGIAVSLFSYLLIILHHQPNRKPILFNALLASSIVLLIFAGHFGASLTHGEDFVLAPIREKSNKIDEETTVFAAAVMPVIDDKCASCHNERKHKGDLIMTNLSDLLKGGENGPLWVEGDSKNSLMIQRVHLPFEEEEHMPPEGKPQLTTAEKELFALWINKGADTKLKISDLNAEDTLYQFISRNSGKKKPAYDFQSASTETIEQLNNPFRTVVPESYNSPALNAHIFVRQNYETSRLTDLLKIRDQLVYLNLTNMPIQDEDMATIAQFKELRELILNGTDITGQTLTQLDACKHLQSLALSGTNVSVENVQSLLPNLSELEELYIWNTSISTEDVENISETHPDVSLQLGYIPDEDELLTLSAPILENESNVLAEDDKVIFKHLFPGVNIRYTIDGTEPDSLASPLYTDPIPLNGFTEIKAKAFIEGWLGSPTLTHTFFKKGFTPTKVELLNPPNKTYPGSGAEGLFDGEKGEPGNFRSPNWLGYRDKPFLTRLDLGNQPPTVQSITFSYAINMGSYIMPPVWVEVWGGNQPDKMKRIKRVTLPKPTDYESNRVGGLDISIGPSEYKYYQVIAEPVRRLPNWHQGSGDKGWVFVDEIFVY